MSNEILNQDNAQATEQTAAPKLKKLAQFQTPDGRIFNTQKEASEHLRAHLVVSAVTAVAEKFTGVDAEGNEQSLAQFLLASKEDLVKAYDAAKVQRPPVSEETKAKMKAARAAGRSLAADPVEPVAPAAE
jgi:hypothetical protein